MSQSHHPTDTQALLQSMLQRLKLQPGREGQAYLQTPASTASTFRQEDAKGATNLQEVNNSPVNVCGVNGIHSKEFRIPAVDSHFDVKCGETKHSWSGSEVGRSLTSFPFQKVSIGGDMGQSRVLGQSTQLGVIPTGTKQLFPAQSLKDTDLTSVERTEGDRVSFGSFSMKRHIPPDTDTVSNMGLNQNQVQTFTPKVSMLSMKSLNADSAGQGNKKLHAGNGDAEGLEPSKDVSSSQKPTNSRRKQRSSETKTRRWTQKIKERWKDRQGSFGKKGKEDEGRVEQRIEQPTQILTPNQIPMTDNLMNTPNEGGEQSFPSLDSSGTSLVFPSQTQDNAVDGSLRCTSDFETGLGSFSLLEEIVRGQEWAKFINPSISATSTNPKPSEELLNPPKIQPNPNQLGGVSDHRSFRSTESSPAAVFRVAQSPPDAFTSPSMNIPKEKQQQWVYRDSDQSEPMEDGHNQSDMQSAEKDLALRLRPSSFTEPADNPFNSALKSRVQTSRKRQHQSAERRDERLQLQKISDGEDADGGSISSPCPTSYHMIDKSGQTQQDILIPLYALNSHPTPLSNTFAPAPRGVLRHTMFQESSMETLTKRRRVEENRRVHFSEEVVTISSPCLDLNATYSDEDSEAEEDSVIEQECEVEPALAEEVAPARRPVLPAWILALKRKNTGRKHR
ncbi:uncharacterized protein [Leuresthes tenuis]|uniref:uncharacterized protein n=1 Tax=Leuresthes tenuis TaxID=355514 RepID=UPI003B50285E